MRVVLDTNVLVQAALAAQGPANTVVSLVLLGKLTLLVEDRIWDEYLDVLSRPHFPFTPSSVAHLLRNLRRRAELVTALPLSKEQRRRLPDASDGPFLEAALGGRAGALITSKMKHFPLAVRDNLIVLPPVEYIQRFVSIDDYLI